MSKEDSKVEVHIKFREIEQTFTGNPEEVWILINRFFAEVFPSIKAIKKVRLTVNLEELIDDLKGIIEISEDSPYVMLPRKKLTDKELLMLSLLGMHIGFRLGILDRDYFTKEELREKLGKSSKILSTRLGELCRDGLVIRNDEEKYRITSFGIKFFQKEFLPKIKAKLFG